MKLVMLPRPLADGKRFAESTGFTRPVHYQLVLPISLITKAGNRLECSREAGWLAVGPETIFAASIRELWRNWE